MLEKKKDTKRLRGTENVLNGYLFDSVAKSRT